MDARFTRSSSSNPLNSFNLYHNKQNVIIDSILDSSGHMGNSMAENYMNKVSGLINDLLMNLNQPKVINFDKLLFILDEELEMVGLKSNIILRYQTLIIKLYILRNLKH